MLRLLLSSSVLLAQGADAGVTRADVEREAEQALRDTGARGLAIALIEDGKVVHAGSFGVRNAAGAPLETDTIMYGASLTKAVFAYYVMQLVDDKRIALDTPIDRYLAKPLPDYPADPRYGPWPDLAGDERWRTLTPRVLLSHGGGFPNFEWDEPDGKLRIHFDPGSRYAYSGTGIILLQFVLEQGLGLDVGKDIQRRIFDPLGMADTSLIWRPTFAANLADGFDVAGKVEPHDERSKVRAAGSMDTTIADFAKFAAAYVRGWGLSASARAELVKAQLPITTASQFPSLQPEAPPAQRRADLAAGLGVIVFDGPQGRGFMKGGHNDTTGNSWVCVEKGRRCVILLANDVRAEPAFGRIVETLIGPTGAPWRWEYGGMTLLGAP
ncbi:serine hydrolase [Sphingosinicella sp. BN140058]|uniref:serine hydrolase domain-containing protein n=1 Tax=Sphingosinicella sp. BN140058 TaxID=1892855 RepID=UPI0019821996|nr:serine hydrolase domain-containing protein [Sphingosinicella sp. BN140058]